MRRATFFLALCCACGGSGPVTNNWLSGRWVSSGDDQGSEMDLVPGADGVSGTFKVFGEINLSGTVSTLPDGRIRWTFGESAFEAMTGKTEDFEIHIVTPICGQQVLPNPLQIREIDMGGDRFIRVGFTPPCSIIPGPS
jgi:hypothetical protein